MTTAAPTVVALSSQIADDGTRWQLELHLFWEKAPVVRITGPARQGSLMDYYATTLMDAVLDGKGLVFGWGQQLFRFSPVATAEIVKEVVSRTPGPLGEFRTAFHPTDPENPLA